MPTSWCVPECTKKGYPDENGRKVSHFKFPNDPLRRKKWIHAIRRDEGVYFQIKERTKVCSKGILESMILSRRSAVGEICDRMPFHRCFLGLEPLFASGNLPPIANKLAQQAEFSFPKLKRQKKQYKQKTLHVMKKVERVILMLSPNRM